jgi:four helix bundle protein
MEYKKIKSFTDLNAWKEAHELVVAVYKITKNYPKEEIFGLVNQMRRCAVSISSNLAEGFTRQSIKEKIQFYSISLGSLVELQNQLLISNDPNIGYIDNSSFNEIANQAVIVQKLIYGLKRSLNRKS